MPPEVSGSCQYDDNGRMISWKDENGSTVVAGRADRWKILQLPLGNMDMRKKSSEGTRTNTVSYAESMT